MSLLELVHARIGGGVTIETFPDEGVVEIRWHRDYGEDGLSDERLGKAYSIDEALTYVLEYEADRDFLDTLWEAECRQAEKRSEEHTSELQSR